VTASEPTPAEAGHLPGDDADAGSTIRDRSVREVVERTRDVIRKTRELLDNSRDLLDRVRHRDDDAPGEHDADEASDDNAGADARPVEGNGREQGIGNRE
jgi:hypothetical protein